MEREGRPHLDMKVASGPFLCSIRQPFLRPDLRTSRRRAQTPSRSAVAPALPQTPASPGRTLTVASTAALSSVSGLKIPGLLIPGLSTTCGKRCREVPGSPSKDVSLKKHDHAHLNHTPLLANLMTQGVPKSLTRSAPASVHYGGPVRSRPARSCRSRTAATVRQSLGS
jgi:hypothetical protein